MNVIAALSAVEEYLATAEARILRQNEMIAHLRLIGAEAGLVEAAERFRDAMEGLFTAAMDHRATIGRASAIDQCAVLCALQSGLQAVWLELDNLPDLIPLTRGTRRRPRRLKPSEVRSAASFRRFWLRADAARFSA